MIIEAILVAGLVLPGPHALKCPRTHTMPGMPPDMPVIVLDGEVVEQAVENAEILAGLVAPEDVYRVDIACWNPVTDALPALSGVQLILITTKEYVAARRREVDELVVAIEAFSKATGRAPFQLDDLPGKVQVDRFEYRTSQSGWSVSNTGTPVAYRCSAEVSPDIEAAVTCEPWHALAKANLRKRYDRGLPHDRELRGHALSGMRL